MGTTWNDERVGTLKRLWAEGLSCSECADRIGGVTRNAVIGKVHRMGLPGRATLKRKHPKARKSPCRRHLETLPVDIPPPAIAEQPIPLHQRRTVDTLEANDCRWPVGDPQEADFHFCGARKLPGLPYCECHARRAFNTAPPSEKAVPRRSAITNSFVGLRRSHVTEDA